MSNTKQTTAKILSFGKESAKNVTTKSNLRIAKHVLQATVYFLISVIYSAAAVAAIKNINNK